MCFTEPYKKRFVKLETEATKLGLSLVLTKTPVRLNQILERKVFDGFKYKRKYFDVKSC